MKISKSESFRISNFLQFNSSRFPSFEIPTFESQRLNTIIISKTYKLPTLEILKFQNLYFPVPQFQNHTHTCSSNFKVCARSWVEEIGIQPVATAGPQDSSAPAFSVSTQDPSGSAASANSQCAAFTFVPSSVGWRQCYLKGAGATQRNTPGMISGSK